MPPAALLVAGTSAISASQQVMQGISEKNAANAQAGQFQAQAGLERQRAGAQIAAQDYETNQAMAQGRVNAAAGGETEGGSAGVVSRLNASYGILKDITARYSGDVEAQKMMAQAAFSRSQGQRALIGGIAGAGGSLLTAGLKTFTPTGAGGLGVKPSDIGKLI